MPMGTCQRRVTTRSGPGTHATSSAEHRRARWARRGPCRAFRFPAAILPHPAAHGAPPDRARPRMARHLSHRCRSHGTRRGIRRASARAAEFSMTAGTYNAGRSGSADLGTPPAEQRPASGTRQLCDVLPDLPLRDFPLPPSVRSARAGPAAGATSSGKHEYAREGARFAPATRWVSRRAFARTPEFSVLAGKYQAIRSRAAGPASPPAEHHRSCGMCRACAAPPNVRSKLASRAVRQPTCRPGARGPSEPPAHDGRASHRRTVTRGPGRTVR